MPERFEDQSWYRQWRSALELVIAAAVARDRTKPATPERDAAEPDCEAALAAFRAIANHMRCLKPPEFDAETSPGFPKPGRNLYLRALRSFGRNIRTDFSVGCYWCNAKRGSQTMQNNQTNATEVNPEDLATAPLLLLKLMRDLAVLEEELQAVENTLGQPVSSYQDPLVERLCRVGVGDQKVEDFIAWRRTISSLISDGSGDENKLAKITAAEATGLALFTELITSMKSRDDGRLLAA
jgi:hypothetical protein